MIIRYENVRECANYLIQLFYKTDKRYSCTRTKIGKLLSILAFKYAAVKEEVLFSEEIYRYPECGTLINSVQVYVDRDVYFCYPYDNSKKRISRSELNENVYIPECYKKVSTLSSKIKEEIEDVFFTFGAYSHVDLGEELNPIVEYPGICQSDGSIKLNNIILLYDKLPGNKVLDYIFNR